MNPKEGIEERKKRRRISNRNSARKSRMKKQQQMDTLQIEITKMESEKVVLKEQIDLVAGNYFEMESENKVLKAQYDELTERLQSLNSFLKMIGFVNGYEIEIPEMPQTLVEPWQLPCSNGVANTGMFKC
ncbi:bZIP transcription factor 53-like [Impatiens glandulifera]|uniref:bZIP transcription factor 53-like n=1 Tax=Impatiens glandulifera TaxID=253017 RepID=UPI001FB18AE1|nr:bZIP transcription factor 53-like [Impatiens glandulifera]